MCIRSGEEHAEYRKNRNNVPTRNPNKSQLIAKFLLHPHVQFQVYSGQIAIFLHLKDHSRIQFQLSTLVERQAGERIMRLRRRDL